MDKNLLQLFHNITSKEHVKWKFYFTCQTSFKVDESPILSSSSCVGYSPFNFHQFLELQNKFHQISRTTLKLIHFQKFVRTFFCWAYDKLAMFYKIVHIRIIGTCTNSLFAMEKFTRSLTSLILRIVLNIIKFYK